MITKVLNQLALEIKEKTASFEIELSRIYPIDSRVMFMYSSTQKHPSYGKVIGWHGSTQKVVILKEKFKNEWDRTKHVYWRNIVLVIEEK